MSSIDGKEASLFFVRIFFGSLVIKLRYFFLTNVLYAKNSCKAISSPASSVALFCLKVRTLESRREIYANLLEKRQTIAASPAIEDIGIRRFLNFAGRL